LSSSVLDSIATLQPLWKRAIHRQIQDPNKRYYKETGNSQEKHAHLQSLLLWLSPISGDKVVRKLGQAVKSLMLCFDFIQKGGLVNPMRYLHTMVRVLDLSASLDFYCNKLGLIEVRRKEYESGRFTLVFLAAPNDIKSAKQHDAPMLELTYNWDPLPYTEGRHEMVTWPLYALQTTYLLSYCSPVSLFQSKSHGYQHRISIRGNCSKTLRVRAFLLLQDPHESPYDQDTDF